MISNNLIQLEQPSTHTAKSSFWQKISCRDYSLTREELKQFYDLKKLSNIMYEGRQEEIQKVRDLYQKYFQKNIGKDFTTKDWLELGFQGDRPEKDLRGAGVLALDLINYYVQKEKDNVIDMAKDQNEFFFAITAINVAFFMKNYFHLSDKVSPNVIDFDCCNRRSLKNFCGMLVVQKNSYFELHKTILSFFYIGIWKKDRKKSLLNFNNYFSQLQKKVKITFQSHQNLQLNDILVSFKTN